MSFRDALGSISSTSGYDAIIDTLAITKDNEQGSGRLVELMDQYPVLTGILDALGDRVQSDVIAGASSAELDYFMEGFGLALGAIALLAESDTSETK